MIKLREHIKYFGTKSCITYKDTTYTYQDLYDKSSILYSQISLRIDKGCIVAVLSDYSFNAIALFLALVENGNIIIPITTSVDNEIRERMDIVSCDYVIILKNEILEIEANSNRILGPEIIQVLVRNDKSGLVLFSSGTTGKPKAMVHDLDNLIAAIMSKGKKGRELVFLIFLMFDHIGGLNTMLNCLVQGMHLVLPDNRNPDYIASLIEKYKINVLPTSPTFLNLMLINDSQKRYNLESLKLITYGTEVMPEALLKKLKLVFSSVKFLQTFGTSETGISQTASRSSDSTFLRIDDPDTEYKIVDNELYLRTKTQILGYINESSDRFTDDGWFKTGDLVEQTEDGYIRVIGRNKEIINVGGEKVLPNEVETVIFQMPEVLDCYVYALPNPITGQMVCAKVLFNKVMSVSEAKDLIVKFCRDKLERYKIPAKVQIMQESEFTDRFKKKRLKT